MSEDSFHLGVKALLCNASGEILLLQVNPARLHGTDRTDYWDLPGGRVQKGETIPQTLTREVFEETGLRDMRATSHIGIVLSNIRIPIGDDSVGLLLSVDACQLPVDAEIKLSDEHIARAWFEPAQAAELLAVKYPADFCQLVANLPA